MKLQNIESRLNKVAPSFAGEKHIPTLVKQLNKAFARTLVQFTSERYIEKYYKDHSVLVSGQYNPRIMGMIPERVLVILSFPANSKKAIITPRGAKFLFQRIVRIIHHEYRHKHQNKGRGYCATKQYKPKAGSKDEVRLRYYGNPDEIDAHAYETQSDRVDINRLRQAHKVGWIESEAMFMYRKHFRKTDPKVWKRFLKKVYKNHQS